MDFDKMKPVQGSTDTSRITKYWPGKAADRTEGMTAMGEFVGEITFDKGTPDETTLYKLKAVDGEIYGVQANTVIKNAFEKIEVGKFVGIRFNGKKTSAKSGRQYNDFEVRVTESTPSAGTPTVQSEGIKLSQEELDDVPFGS